MKIPSWTGNEVEARVGMVCEYKYDSLIMPVTINKILDDGRIIDDDNRTVIASTSTQYLTMLQCPFQVVDEVEVKLNGEWILYGDYCEALLHDPLIEGIRHANPDLRTSPEYKP